MADPKAVVPYHDPHDHDPFTDIMDLFYDDSEQPRLDENAPPPPLDQGGVIPLYGGGTIGDVNEPLIDAEMWDFINVSDDEGGDVDPQEPGPSRVFEDSGEPIPPGGDDNEQNHEVFVNTRPLSIWLPEPVPFNCSCCQVLRDIIHLKGNHVMKLEIHGRLGVICHAILHTWFNLDVNSSDNHQYQLFNFCKKGMEDVKLFLVQYCLDRKLQGYIMQQDPMSSFYEVLCVGLEWGHSPNTTNDFIFPPSQPISGLAGAMKQQPPEPPPQPPATENNEVEVRPRRISLAQQRERTRKMTLDDLREYFHIPIEKAARKLRVCPTVVKRISRRGGLRRWPSRKIKSIERQISKLRPGLDSNDPQIRAKAQEAISSLENEIAKIEELQEKPVRLEEQSQSA